MKIKEIIEKLASLSEKEVLSYWIRGEYEEADLYWALAKRAKELGLDDELIGTFVILAKESKGHGTRLFEIYKRRYGEQLEEVHIPPVEVLPLLEKFKNASDVISVLYEAMRSELLAKAIYEELMKKVQDDRVRKVYEYLAIMEQDHYNQLKKEYELYMRKYASEIRTEMCAQTSTEEGS
ncbi:ferritin-like domain-containing protein [Thermococcus sp.]